MSKLKTVPLDENGKPLSDDALASFLDEGEPIDVPYTKRNGKLAFFHAFVDHSRVKAPHLKKYQREVQEIAEETERRAEEETAREAAQDAKSDADDDEGITASELASQLDVFDVMGAYAQTAADLLGRIVIETDIPGLEVHPENGVSPEFLCERTGVGPTLRQALFAYFFPSSKQPEAETGTTEEASITPTSAISEATDDAESIQPISSSSTSPAPSKSRPAKS